MKRKRNEKYIYYLLNLDSSGIHHLLTQVVLVLSNGAVPSANSLVFAYQDVLGNLVQKSVIGRVSITCNTVKYDGLKAYRKS